MTDTTQLIQEYVKSGSEAAFGELVRRYIDLVYSVALRRVTGDAHMAQDVTQVVFSDLARKAGSLPADVMLGGWLHRHTGFVASNVVRAEQRRHARERQAVEMNLNDSTTDPLWRQLAPMLDEAIDQLDSPERDAVVMRYFEHRDLRTIGVVMGVSEDAAQKRVSRAVDKLREMIGRQGVTMTVTLLAGVLAARSVAAAPTGLAATVSTTAMAGVAGGGAAVAILKLLAGAKVKIALAAALVLGVALPVILHPRSNTQGSGPLKQALTSNTIATAVVSPPPAVAEVIVPVEARVNAHTNGAKILNLTILDDKTSSPVPGVPMDFRSWIKSKFVGKKIKGDADGVCVVEYASNVTELEITTRVDGYADTRLQWSVKNGETIPTNYTLRLVQPVMISGVVLDADGNPVSGAEVGFNDDSLAGMSVADQRPESHSFGWIAVKTDPQGKWVINRIAPEMTRRLYGSARHPEHLDTPMVFTSRDSEAEKQMRQGTYVFHLGRAINVPGVVVNAEGEPVAGAKILAGYRDMSDRRETTSSADGTFVLAGCKPGKNLLTAECAGYATTTIEVDASEESLPFKLTLQRGKILRLSVVNQAGQPVRGANVWLSTMPSPNVDVKLNGPVVQADFSPRTDKEGKIVWSNAPDGELQFEIAATGYFRQDEVKARPDGQEHIITLLPALTISGTVVDADSCQPLPNFRIVTGWPEPDYFNGVTNAMWSTIDRFWLSFSGGKFRHQYEEAVVGGTDNRGYMLKFTADGYAPFVTRVIKPDEGEVNFNVELSRAHATGLTVMQPDGQPAAGADVGLVMPSSRLMLIPGGISRENLQVGGSLLDTDNNGKVQVPPDETIKRVVFAHATGYAEVTGADLKNLSAVQLQPWGRIEGDYFAGGKPAVDREISAQRDKYQPGDVSFDCFRGFKIKTDAAGHFVFPQVPPGDVEVVKLISQSEEGRNISTYTPLQTVAVRAGETATIEIGKTGYTVTAKINWAGGEQAPANASFHGTLASDLPMPSPPDEIKNDAMALSQWRRSPEVQAAMKAIQRFPLEMTPDGTVSAENVPAGDYVISAGYSQQFKPGETPPQFYFGGHLKVTVPADPPTGTLDAGQIDIIKQTMPQMSHAH